MDSYYDLHHRALIKSVEELCGDTVKSSRTDDSTIVVLSDGLGSGVKACILSTLTAEIIVDLLTADVPIQEAIHTVLGTLPTCRVRRIAYATFTVIRISHADGRFNVINFDNPPVLLFKRGRLAPLRETRQLIHGQEIAFSEGTLEIGDFLGAASDGVVHAGLGMDMDFGWGWDNLGRFVEGQFIRGSRSATALVDGVIGEVERLYHGRIGDDASFLGVQVRRRNALMIFTGPPLDPRSDNLCVERILNFPGKRIVCGGTTGNIVATHVGRPIETDLSTLREHVPPIGSLPEVDLLTEGIFTMSQALEYLMDCQGNPQLLPRDRNGAVLLAREMLAADSVDFLVGQRVNEYFQNPLLPPNFSIRCKLVEDIARLLTGLNKTVRVDLY